MWVCVVVWCVSVGIASFVDGYLEWIDRSAFMLELKSVYCFTS